MPGCAGTLSPTQREQRSADALIRKAVPIIGVLFLHYDAPRLVLIYLFDTWMGRLVVAVLDVLLTRSLIASPEPVIL